jgi:hypothetical protein
LLIIIATYATFQIDFCNIQIKYFIHKYEMPKTLENTTSPTAMAYLVGELLWGMGRSLGRPVHGVAQDCELILSSSSYFRVIARQSARCADPLLHCFDALFAALVKQGSSLGAGDRTGYATPPKMDQKARKMQCLVATMAHTCHELDALAELEQPVLAPALAALRQGAARPSACVAG